MVAVDGVAENPAMNEQTAGLVRARVISERFLQRLNLQESSIIIIHYLIFFSLMTYPYNMHGMAWFGSCGVATKARHM